MLSRFSERVVKMSAKRPLYRWLGIVVLIILFFARVASAVAAPGQVTISPVSGLLTSENGTQAEFTIQLNQAPYWPVKIGLSSERSGEGTLSTSYVLFNSDTWDDPVTITVTGMDDDQLDGDIDFKIVVSAAQSFDPYFNGVDPDDVSVTNRDNEGGPVAVDDSTVTDEEISVTHPVLENDQELSKPPFIVAIVIDPNHGSAQANSDQTITYTPDPLFTGEDGFGYEVCDDYQRCSNAQVSIVVEAVNHPPVAVDDLYTVNANEPLSISSPGVLSNDTDDKSSSLEAVLTNETNSPTNGVLELKSNGSFLYTPNENFIGQDNFSYHANDGSLISEPATVTVEVNDLQAPTVTWSAPSNDQQVYQVGLERIQLQVEAYDNIALERVHFFRWDALTNQYVDIGDVYEPPYVWDLDASELRPDWNQVFAKSYDTSGNESERQYIWLYQTGVVPPIFMPLLFH
jgi:hypothetical protein